METKKLFCGIDLGTQGARCALVSQGGEVAAEGSAALGTGSLASGDRFEQDPAGWLEAVSRCVADAVRRLHGTGGSPGDVAGIGVTSTSGTVCMLDDSHRPLGRAVMYSDSRSGQEAERVQEAGRELTASLGYRFKPSFALPKILWLKNHRPELVERTALFLPPTDLVIGWLTGQWGVTDRTNALKYGYDLLNDRWPDFIERDLGIPLAKLPRVVTTGHRVGELRAERVGELGLPAGTPVAAGLTDGCASQMSSGAVKPGDFNTTIGTTLVMKGVTKELLIDPEGRIYCHHHPQGWWLPGGASNTGAECLAKEFGDEETPERSLRALSASPTSLVAYPLVRRGERFPFSRPDAEGFLLGEPASRDELFAGFLEGVACVERLALEMLQELGARPGHRILSAGGGARSGAWLQIRADILDRRVARPAVTGAAMGAAIVAASMIQYADIAEAAENMVSIEEEKSPRSRHRAAYDEKYRRFRAECARRGYIRD